MRVFIYVPVATRVLAETYIFLFVVVWLVNSNLPCNIAFFFFLFYVFSPHWQVFSVVSVHESKRSEAMDRLYYHDAWQTDVW